MIESIISIISLVFAASLTFYTVRNFKTLNGSEIKEKVVRVESSLPQDIHQSVILAEKVSTAASTISNYSHKSEDEAYGLSSILGGVLLSTNQISSFHKEQNNLSKEVQGLATQARESAKKGNQWMQEMVAAMAEISEAGQGIRKIIKVIDEIAFQTNLLALNAAVEAARAGQHGKGFATVAEEVRNLAARSAQAAQETANLIEESAVKTNSGGEIAKNTAESFERILSSIERINSIMSEIALASKKQSNGIFAISASLQEIDKSTQLQTANSVLSAAAEELSENAYKLKEKLSRYGKAG